MKTKSKRFLNLATLCLALLGTTLLMTRPVKAEVTVSEGESASHQTTKSTSLGNLFLSSEGGENGRYDYDFWHRLGYSEGYEKGKESDGPGIDNIDVPENVLDKGAYKDGYEGGHEAGWRDTHPIESLLDMAWQFLTYAFNNLFGFGQNTQ
ncbi:hypothetical membrane associated protein [Streptococcus pyogenes]|uniref:hypothetical protein n=1 Tax=Streptococcus pyogenes TaxID=1314 RepID=UPI00109C2F08|nr:hypothetical protein [Streptococcus pyogenes]NAZ56029.1 hypothetical protein [Streptococcus pyogenes]QCK46952.1 hypothetical protein ETT60_01940 [Streptococcus pyogenes]VGT76696.1 hypothetical membrane associated protein [Streptococcus pyogenes]VGT80909.1 hypothetical membrane associated protein [Streptococcus pyogenes]VGW08401.1 Uncharacterised protein [Streptococcus pyogenes]